jgi:regulator of protease activity HflC (stomatin/prohibitin superfamily)
VLFPLIVVAIFLMIVVAKTIIVVPPNEAYVVERLGRYHRTIRSGLQVLTPFLDRVAFRYTLRPQDAQLTDRCITLDNIPISVTSSVRWEIADPQSAAYNSANVKDFVLELIRSRQREWIAEHSWNDTREGTRELQSTLLRTATEPAAQAGARIIDVYVNAVTRAVAE